MSEKEYTPEDFLKAIDDLSKKMGYGLDYSPMFFKQIDGSFSIKINLSVYKKKPKSSVAKK